MQNTFLDFLTTCCKRTSFTIYTFVIGFLVIRCMRACMCVKYRAVGTDWGLGAGAIFFASH